MQENWGVGILDMMTCRAALGDGFWRAAANHLPSHGQGNHDRKLNFMICLLLSIACSVSIAHLFKYAEEHDFPKLRLYAVNYFVGSMLALTGGGRTFRAHFSPLLLLLGIIVGILFVCSYILMGLAMKRLGVTIPVALMRLSAVLPTVGSVFFFAEIPKTLQILGITLAFLSLPLASQEHGLLQNMTQLRHNGFGWGLMLFAVFGVTNFIFKIQYELLPLANPAHFLMIIFPTAFVVSLIIGLRQKNQFTKRVFGLGLILGTINLFASYFFMSALQALPGIVVYPINGIGIILVSALTSNLIWQERLTRSNFLFIAAASLAVLLIFPR